ncbi:MAG: PTS sugar transporter subunit IIA [Planctomycetota bacterium]
MRLTDILQPDCIRVPLTPSTKQGAIFELADLLVDKTGIEDADELKAAIWKRETTRTTGIGGGIAVPHGKTDGVDRLRMAIGRTSEPIDFGSIDRKPVELIILLASPIDQTGPHITALSKISQMLIDVVVREQMKKCATGDEMYALIEELESRAAV